MRTPSLRARVVASGVAVVVVVLVGLDVFLYVNLRTSLLGNLEEVLDTRAQVVRAEAAGLNAPEAAEVLGRIGLEAVVRKPDGTTYRAQPVWPGLSDDVAPRGGAEENLLSRRVALAQGVTVDVSVRRSDVDVALRRLLVAEAAGTVAATVLAALLLLRASGVALQPLSRIVAAARRTAAGHRGERLHPDRPDTSLGEMAAAYDDMLDALEAALADAQAAEDRSRRFLAGAAHQLRTPIASIQMGAENLIRAGPGAVDALAASLVHETSRAARLIGGLLEMARLDRGEPLVPAPCDLVALCRDEADRVASRARALEIVVSAGDLPDTPAELDAHAVREILANLLDNARRHARERVEVTVGAATACKGWEVRVRDDGPGLPEGAEERVFERFVSLDGKGGSGLGLAIARDLARTHGGDLVYEGTAFALRLPASSASGLPAVSEEPGSGRAGPVLPPPPVAVSMASGPPAPPAPRR